MRIWLETPEWLLLLPVVLTAVGIPLLVRSLAGLSGTRRWMALTLRALVMALLVFCLARPHWTRHSDGVAVVYLLDRSDSIPSSLRQDALGFVQRTQEGDRKRPDDMAGVITFGGRASVEQVPVAGDYVPPIGKSRVEPGQTNLAEAIRLAAAVFPPDRARRIVILSDGNQTAGDAVAEARRVAAAAIGIDVVPLDYRHDREIRITNFWAPARARAGDEIPLKISIHSEAAVEADLTITDNGIPITIDPARRSQSVRVRLERGKNALVQTVRLGADTSIHRFGAQVRPVRPDDDSIPQNNQASAFTTMAGKGKVLLVSTSREDDATLEQALRQEQIEVVTVEPQDIPPRLEDYAGYSAVVLSNVPADLMPRPLQQSLAAYVRDLGGGLVVIGGDQAFGAGAYAKTPLEEVLPVRSDFKRELEEPSVALALVIDKSGSMSGEKMEMAKRAAEATVEILGDHDHVAVIAFDGVAQIVSPLRSLRDRGAILGRIRNLGAGGGTNLGPALTLAGNMLAASTADLKHVIALTDGQSLSADFAGIVGSMARSGITISTVGVGRDADAQLLEQVAQWGKGRFYPAPHPHSLPQIYLKEIRRISRSLLYERPFAVQRHDFSPVTGNLAGDEIPHLEGMVLTMPKPLAQIPLVSVTEKGRVPLLANWQVGLGRGVAFTSGMWRRWGPRWLAWEKFAPLWGQIVRWAMRKDGADDLDVQATIEQGVGRVVIDAMDKTAGYLNFLQIAGTVLDPDLEAAPLEVNQTAPGHYEATFEADAAGVYIIGLQCRRGNDVTFVQTGVASSYSPEYGHLQANPLLLATLAETGGGQVLPLAFGPGAADVFRRDLPPAASREPAWPAVLALALGLFLLDVAVRRIAIDPRAMLAEARDWMGGLAGRWGGREGGESLGSLKQRREQLQAQWQGRPGQQAPPAPSPGRRGAKAASPAGKPGASAADQVESLMPPRDTPPAAREREDAREDDPTSRLLNAKRRARQRMEETPGD